MPAAQIEFSSGGTATEVPRFCLIFGSSSQRNADVTKIKFRATRCQIGDTIRTDSRGRAYCCEVVRSISSQQATIGPRPLFPIAPLYCICLSFAACLTFGFTPMVREFPYTHTHHPSPLSSETIHCKVVAGLVAPYNTVSEVPSLLLASPLFSSCFAYHRPR